MNDINTNKYALSNINYTNTLFLILTPILLVVFTYLWVLNDGFNLQVLAIAIFTYIISGISITAGYHRLFAHKTYEAHPVIKVLFLIFGATAFQNSVLKWASDHRLHHSKVDSESDPYNINEGFFFAHMGWIFLNKNSDIKERYAKDMLQDKAIMFQHKYYTSIAIIFGFIIPTAILYFIFNSFLVGIFVTLFRIVMVHHCTFFINSLCHCVGSRPYTDTNSAKDNWFMAFLTFGEGYHNFHHYFQTDFRNGIRWYHFDPTKWLIKLFSYLKLASNLKVTSKKRILEAKLNMSLKKVESLKTFEDKRSEFDEMKARIIDSLRKIETFKNELKISKPNLDKLSIKLAKLKIQEAKKDLQIHLVLWRLNLKKFEQLQLA